MVKMINILLDEDEFILINRVSVAPNEHNRIILGR